MTLGQPKKIQSINPCGSEDIATLICNGTVESYWDRHQIRHPICDLPSQEILEITSKPCFYCADDIDRRSVDRIDNSVGHIKSNVVPSCYTCNSVRMNNFSHQEMKLIGKTIAEIKKARRS